MAKKAKIFSETCKKCSKVIIGTSPTQLEHNVEMHEAFKHNNLMEQIKKGKKVIE